MLEKKRIESDFTSSRSTFDIILLSITDKIKGNHCLWFKHTYFQIAVFIGTEKLSHKNDFSAKKFSLGISEMRIPFIQGYITDLVYMLASSIIQGQWKVTTAGVGWQQEAKYQNIKQRTQYSTAFYWLEINLHYDSTGPAVTCLRFEVSHWHNVNLPLCFYGRDPNLFHQLGS